MLGEHLISDDWGVSDDCFIIDDWGVSDDCLEDTLLVMTGASVITAWRTHYQ